MVRRGPAADNLEPPQPEATAAVRTYASSQHVTSAENLHQGTTFIA